MAVESAIDRSALLERVGHDTGFLSELTQAYFDGRSQLFNNLRTALNRRDAGALARAAHAVKGCVATLGGEAASRVAGQLEHVAKQGDLTNAAAFLAELEQELLRFESALLNLASELGRR